MNDTLEVFVGHAEEDADRAAPIVEALESQGWSVGRESVQRNDDAALSRSDAALQHAKCVIVLWSRASLMVPKILEFAQLAQREERLLSVRIEEVELPSELDEALAVDLIDWRGDEISIDFLKLLARVTTMVSSADEVTVRSSPRRKADPASPSEPVYDENVQFTVYRPNVLAPQAWHTMLAFAHLAEAIADGDPDPVQEVERQAQQLLGEDFDDFSRSAQDASQAVPREGTITFVPIVEGVEFNPSRRSFVWQESIHQEAFRLRAGPDLDGRTARGRMSVYLGVILLAEVNLTFRVQSGERETQDRGRTSARPYRRIFPSYSHRDTAIVAQFRAYGRILGDDYLQDVAVLRSGEVWSDRIRELIASADVFQLFWSHDAMASPYVEQEWRYALSLRRPEFIRPVYWQQPLPRRENPTSPPAELTRLHFEFIGATDDPIALEIAPPVDVSAPQPRSGSPVGAPPPPRSSVPAPKASSRPGISALLFLIALLVVIALWWALG